MDILKNEKEIYKTSFSQKSCKKLLLETLDCKKHLHLVSCIIYKVELQPLIPVQ